MYTPGPAMSFFTSERLLPQKLHIVIWFARAIGGYLAEFRA
jgi:hypothetical protein